MKQDEKEEIKVIATNKQEDSVIQKVCDEWYPEPLSEGDEYIQECLQFCKEHKVDVFVPRRNMTQISENRQRFQEIGVKVMVDDNKILKLLNDKAATYDFFKDCGEISIPQYHMVNTVQEFEQAYRELKKNCDQVCVKFVKDEGAMSYRRIIEQTDRFQRLRVYQGAEMTYGDYVAALGEVERFNDLMVMPYLPGKEISVDCLNTEQGLIAVPRFKSSSRHEQIRFDKEILKMSRIIMEKTNLQYPCNIQFKIKDDIPYLLEINTRMSGGLQMTCEAEKINIPNIALHKVLGRKTEWYFEPVERTVSYIELPRIIR
jgi:carbamoylphosphate synthase large subunit